MIVVYFCSLGEEVFSDPGKTAPAKPTNSIREDTFCHLNYVAGVKNSVLVRQKLVTYNTFSTSI
jgi:hypothetical protein